jgi:serine/threonine protein kinase
VLLEGRFELGRRLGAGGLAEVFAARDRRTGAEVAVKLLHAHLAREEEVRRRFRRELAIARSLDHPNIVRVFDLHGGKRPFITLELLRGRTKRGASHARSARRSAPLTMRASSTAT